MKLFRILLLCMAFSLSTSYAQTDTSVSEPKTKKTKKASKSDSSKKVKSVQFDRGTEESPGARESRLRRECKGRPNAGACAGLAS